MLCLELVQIHLKLGKGLVQSVLLDGPPPLGRQTETDKLATFRPPYPLFVQVDALGFLVADVGEGHRTALSVRALAQKLALSFPHHHE